MRLTTALHGLALVAPFVVPAKAQTTSAAPVPTQLAGTASTEQWNAFQVIIPAVLGVGATVVDAVGETVECGVCQGALAAIAAFCDVFGEDLFADAAIAACSLFEEPDMCSGLVDQQGPVLFQAFTSSSQWLGYTGELLCNGILSTCSSISPQLPKLNIPAPLASPVAPMAVNDSTDPFVVLHVSDIHYDPLYAEGQEVDCKYPLCCEVQTSPDTITNPASAWGAYNCDIPKNIIESFVSTLESVVGAAPNMSLFTGDVPPHNVWYDNQTNVETAFGIFEVLQGLPGGPLIAAIGNHDTAPLNLFEPAGLLSGQSISNEWVFTSLGQQWSSWLPENVVNEFQSSPGVFTIRPTPGLKIISMNTVDCYTLNLYLYFDDVSQKDPNGQLQWIIDELADSESKGESVWLIAHVPPGNGDCLVSWATAFQSIVERFSSTIKAQFYGHTHNDEFAVHYDKNNNPISFQMWAPSLTTYTDLNVGYRTYTVDPSTFEILDSKTYYADISQASTWTEPNWQFEYSARQYLPSWPQNAPLNATFWSNVADAIGNSDDLFAQYYTFRSKSSSVESACTSGECKNQIVQDLKAGNSLNRYYPTLLDELESLVDSLGSAAASALDPQASTGLAKRKCVH